MPTATAEADACAAAEPRPAVYDCITSLLQSVVCLCPCQSCTATTEDNSNKFKLAERQTDHITAQLHSAKMSAVDKCQDCKNMCSLPVGPSVKTLPRLVPGVAPTLSRGRVHVTRWDSCHVLQGIAEYEPHVVDMLIDFVYSYSKDVLTDAQAYGEAAGTSSTSISLQDVELAIRSRSFTQAVSLEVRLTYLRGGGGGGGGDKNGLT